MLRLKRAGAHVYATDIWNYPLLDKVEQAILRMRDSEFDRYDNPFEGKSSLHAKFNLPDVLTKLVDDLEGMAGPLSELFRVKLIPDHHRWYFSVFKYGRNDHLSVHVDAGVHPLTELRKHVTGLLYLSDGGGALEMWNGSNCMQPGAGVFELSELIKPFPGKVVFFENNDYAWHGVGIQPSDEPRIVVTVSYLSDEVHTYSNKRQKAYFVPRPGEHWSPETFALRDARADPNRASEVYRV